MSDCAIVARDAILNNFAHIDEGMISTIRDMDQNLLNVDVLLYRRHCNTCANVFFILVEAKQ